MPSQCKLTLPEQEDLRALILTSEIVRGLGGFGSRAMPELFDADGGRVPHAGMSAALGLLVGGAMLFALAPACRWPLGLSLVMVVVTIVALEQEVTVWIAAPLCLGTLAVLVGVVARALLSPALVTFGAMAAALLTACCVWLIARNRWASRRKESGLAALARLHAEVDQFNALVCTAGVARRLLVLSDAASSQAMDTGCLVRTRRDLIVALQTERIVRENRDLLGIRCTGPVLLTVFGACRVHGHERSSIDLAGAGGRMARERALAEGVLSRQVVFVPRPSAVGRSSRAAAS